MRDRTPPSRRSGSSGPRSSATTRRILRLFNIGHGAGRAFIGNEGGAVNYGYIAAAARGSGVRKVIFSSSGGAGYGEQEYFPADEKHPLHPVSPYGVAKVSVELYLQYYRVQYGLEYTALRYSNVYGPRQDPHGEAGVVAIFCERLLAGQTALVNGDGLQTRDYVYVGDVVRANLEALSRGDGLSINIGTGTETDVNTLFRTLRDLSGSGQEEIHGPAMPGEQRRSVIDNRMAFDELGWYPVILLDEGLALTLAYFRDKVKSSGTR